MTAKTRTRKTAAKTTRKPRKTAATARPAVITCGVCGEELAEGDLICHSVGSIATDDGGRPVMDDGGRPVRIDK